MIGLFLSSIYATDISAVPNGIDHAGAAQPLHYSSAAGTNNQDLTVRCPCSWLKMRRGLRIASDLLFVGAGSTLIAGTTMYPVSYHIPGCSDFVSCSCNPGISSDPTSTMGAALGLTITGLALAGIERVMGFCEPAVAITPSVGTRQPSYGTPQ